MIDTLTIPLGVTITVVGFTISALVHRVLSNHDKNEQHTLDKLKEHEVKLAHVETTIAVMGQQLAFISAQLGEIKVKLDRLVRYGTSVQEESDE